MSEENRPRSLESVDLVAAWVRVISKFVTVIFYVLKGGFGGFRTRKGEAGIRKQITLLLFMPFVTSTVLELSHMGGYLYLLRLRVNTCRSIFTYKANDVR